MTTLNPKAHHGNTNRRKGALPMKQVSWRLSVEDIEAIKRYRAEHDNMTIADIIGKAMQALLKAEINS